MNWKLKKKIIEMYGSQINFSDETGLRESLISRVIRGHQTLSPEEKRDWSIHLQVKEEDLFCDL